MEQRSAWGVVSTSWSSVGEFFGVQGGVELGGVRRGT